MSGEMATKLIANTVIWFFATLILHFPAQAYLEINVEFAFFVFVFISLCLALTGTVVQGIFIKADNFKLTPRLSIVAIGTLVMTVFLLLLAIALNVEIQFLFHVVLTSVIQIYLITTISYYASR